MVRVRVGVTPWLLRRRRMRSVAQPLCSEVKVKGKRGCVCSVDEEPKRNGHFRT